MMMRGGSILTLGLLLGSVALAPSAFGHATYNTAGYGSGPGGSTNGADGSPTASPPAVWTNGPPEGYTGALPVNWYCGMHSRTQVRTIQTGAGLNPPSGSLLAQITSYNASNDPDIPTDLALVAGGLSWTDPSNDNQGWGHGLDFGIVHFSPIEELLMDGPLAFTVTLTDDSADGEAVQLAFAVYGGWDTSSTSVRHQTFVTNPAPVDNPLGSAGLTLLDYSVATARGQTISRTFPLDPIYGGHYTIFVAAQGGAPLGQYALTVTTAPLDGICEADPDGALAECQSDLATMTTNYDTATADADGDGKRNQDDTCPDTQTGAAIDAAGCSQTQFCSAVDVSTKSGRKVCPKADWKNDQPVMKKKERDCEYDKAAKLCRPAS